MSSVGSKGDSYDNAMAEAFNSLFKALKLVCGSSGGTDAGLKWSEEDKLKADMMNRPDRWSDVSVDQVRAKCKELGMRPKDADTVADLLRRRKDGRRFNVRSTYKNFSCD